MFSSEYAKANLSKAALTKNAYARSIDRLSARKFCADDNGQGEQMYGNS